MPGNCRFSPRESTTAGGCRLCVPEFHKHFVERDTESARLRPINDRHEDSTHSALLQRPSFADMEDRPSNHARDTGCGNLRDRAAACRKTLLGTMVLRLGELFLSPELLAIPSQGIVRACSRQLNADRTQAELPCEIRVEYFARGSEAALSLASLTVPLQPYDGLAGYALKTDLITDDMLVQTITTLQTENPADASKAVGKWIDEMFSPYLIPLEHTRAQVAQAARPNRRLRSVWKLCVETLVFSPGAAIQNWHRRSRGQ